MSHTPLGEVCLSLGIMRPEDIDAVLAEMREGGRTRFGELAVEMGLLDDDGLARAVAQQFRLNMVPEDRLARLSIAPEVLDLIPRGLIRERMLVPTFLDEEKRVLSLLTADPTDIPSLRAAQTAARAARLRLFVAPRSAMRSLIDRLLPIEAGDEVSEDGSAGLLTERRPTESPRATTVIFEPEPERANVLKRLEMAESGSAEIVGDPEQVSAFIEANQADRVFYRHAVTAEVEPYLAAWRNLRPLMQLCPVDGFGPSRRSGLAYEPARDFFLGLLEHLLLGERAGPEADARTRLRRAAELAREMADELGLPDEHRDNVALAALFMDLAEISGEAEGVGEDRRFATADELLLRFAPPFDVHGIFDALGKRVRGEEGPGRNLGAEILYTARAAARASLGDADDPILGFGADAARHDADALRALAAVLRRQGLRHQVAAGGASPPNGEARTGASSSSGEARLPGAPPSSGAAGLARASSSSEARLAGASSSHGATGLPSASLSGERSPPGVSGRLADLSLVDVLQTLTLGGKTAVVQIVGGADLGTVQVRDGRIVAASHGVRDGEEAFHTLAAVDDGRFEIRFEDGGRTNLGGSSEFLMLEAARRRDERRV